MKILAFASSPRKNGNSDILLDEALKGAVEQGAEVEKVYLDDLSIGACKACNACRTGAKLCIIQDDMQDLYPKLAEADIWVMALPIYWWGPPAQLKLMVDRIYGSYKEDGYAGKKAALIITMGDTHIKVAGPTVWMFDMMFDYLHMGQFDPLVASAYEAGEILRNQEALTKAYQLGIHMALQS